MKNNVKKMEYHYINEHGCLLFFIVKEPSNCNHNVGDTLCISNQNYTIKKIEKKSNKMLITVSLKLIKK